MHADLEGSIPQSVAVIGAGTIARTVGEAVADGRVPGFRLTGFLTRTPKEDLPAPEWTTLEELIAARPAVVIEAASQDAVREYAAAVLESGADLICVSVGSLGDAELRSRLTTSARRGGARLMIPSGAIGGLDLLSAAANAGLAEVVVEQRKPPRSLLPQEEAAALQEPLLVFEGNAGEAAREYPKTSNVAASVALAGAGFERTAARVFADPSVSANKVLLRARGDFGTMTLTLENVPSPNPRTSMIVSHSVLTALRRLGQPLVVPA